MFQNTTPGVASGSEASHLMAASLAHKSRQRAAIAKALGGNPVSVGTASPMGPAAPAPGGMLPQHQQGNYKAHIAQAAAQHGVQASVGHVHAAIDSLTNAGHFTPYQGSALKQHNGPLEGAAGAATMGKIAHTVITGAPPPVMGDPGAHNAPPQGAM